jgi:copper(I)-binding protein
MDARGEDQMMVRLPLVGFLLAALVALPAVAQSQGGASIQSGPLTIDGAWARATPASASTGAIYLTIRNHGDVPDRLLAATTPAAGRAELHVHVHDGNVARMQQVPAIEVPRHGAVSLAPGSAHVMLRDLKGGLAEGARVALTLTFAKTGAVTIEVPVLRRPPAPAPAHGAGHPGS